MNRASFELFAKELRRQGYTDEQIREVLETMIKEGLAEGDDAQGYILTEKGVTIAEKKVFASVGVV